MTSFLQTIYDSVAETLPDVKDDGVETALHLTEDGSDPYAVAMDLQTEAPVGKVRKYKKGLNLHVERRPEISGLEVRYLPPGNMSEYYEQFKGMEGTQSASFAVFWRTWRVEFGHLRFRPVSSHSQCSSCLHHKILLRELCPYIHARQHQAALYHAHLMSQYRDRQTYWSLRGSSRLRVLNQITVIQDGMDQCKFMWPRTPLVRAKDLSLMNRPKLSIVGSIAHGFSLLFAVSNMDHPKDSSSMTEIFAHMLTRLSAIGVPLRDTVVHLVSDNTSRETKNNTTLRFLAGLVHCRYMA